MIDIEVQNHWCWNDEVLVVSALHLLLDNSQEEADTGMNAALVDTDADY